MFWDVFRFGRGPHARGDRVGQKKNLDERSGREDFDEAAGRRFHFDGGFAYCHAEDALELDMEGRGGGLKQALMELIDAGGALGRGGHLFFGKGERILERDDKRLLTHEDGAGFGRDAGGFALERDGGPGDFLGDRRCGFRHGICP